MNRAQRVQLEAEARDLESRLKALSPARIIEIRSLQHRLSEVSALLSEASNKGREPASARLTFSGAPVINSYGVNADFGTEATHAFVEAVVAAAAAEEGPLAPRGRIPNLDQNRLLITGTALGSFGFELEESATSEPVGEEGTPVARALVEIRQVLESSVGTDEQLTETVAATDGRALRKIRDFLLKLSQSEAVCELDVGGRKFKFDDVEQVRRAADRLGEQNVQQIEEKLVGAFTGILPNIRRFEFRNQLTDEVFSGQIAPEAGKLEQLEGLNEHLNVETTIRVLTTRVGTGRARYALLEIPEWTRPTEGS